MQKKLYRSIKNKKIAGVAAGLAEYFNIDPTIVRVLFVIAVFLEGFGLIAYAILWAVTPQEPIELAYGNFSGNNRTEKDKEKEPVTDANYEVSGEPEESNTENKTADKSEAPKREYKNYVFENDLPYKHKKAGGSIIAGSILVIIGALFLVKYFVHSFHIMDFFPLIFIAVGAGLLISSFKKV